MRLINYSFCERVSANMPSTADAINEDSSISNSSKTSSIHADPTFLSRQEFNAQCPDIRILIERHGRGEITHKEWISGLKSISDHLTAKSKREHEFAERERQGEVSSAELQREYGWTDEDIQRITDQVELESQNIARCSTRSRLYRNPRGH